jgi:hypothetical protein
MLGRPIYTFCFNNYVKSRKQPQCSKKVFETQKMDNMLSYRVTDIAVSAGKEISKSIHRHSDRILAPLVSKNSLHALDLLLMEVNIAKKILLQFVIETFKKISTSMSTSTQYRT